MVVLTCEANYKGPNFNLRFFQSQNLQLMNSRWQSLINFSHQKAVFINNLELNRKDSISPLAGVKRQQSLIPKVLSKPDIAVKAYPKSEQKQENKAETEALKELMTKKELVEKSFQLIMDLDVAQKEINNKQGIIPFDHRRNLSQNSKMSNDQSLKEINEDYDKSSHKNDSHVKINPTQKVDVKSLSLKSIAFSSF